MIETVFLSGDVDAIKEFVFETSSLPQVRGGSQLLIECEEAVQRYVKESGGRVIYCSGGGFLFEVPAIQAEEIKQWIERIYLDKTLVATVTVVSEAASPQSSSRFSLDGWAGRIQQAIPKNVSLDGSFTHRAFVLGAHLREAKARKAYAPFFEALPFGKRCESCGKRMATDTIERREPEEIERGEPIAICPVCNKKHQLGRRGKGQTRGKFNEEFQRCKSPVAQQAPDLDHLVNSARRKYVAFLYADGNDIGNLLGQMKSSQEYNDLSQALLKGTQTAMFDALAEVCQAELAQEGYWPFEIVNVGGDDVTLLIQAGYAWEVANKFLGNFEREISQCINQQVTASCGIVIADVKYPMRYLESLASESLKRTKKLAKSDQSHPQSAIDFLWLSNPVMSEQIEPLMNYYRREGYTVTARPYTLEQAQQIIILVERASEWPRSQRHQWGEALEKGVYVSLNTIYYNVARRSEQDRVTFGKFLNDVGALVTGNQHPVSSLWKMDDDNEYRTALLDVLELAELRATRKDVKAQEETE